MSQFVEHALLGVAAIITAITGFVALLLQNRRQHRTLRNVERAVNHVDEEVTEDGLPTLGQRVKQMQEDQKREFAKNDQDHASIFTALRHFVERFDRHVVEADTKFVHKDDQP